MHLEWEFAILQWEGLLNPAILGASFYLRMLNSEKWTRLIPLQIYSSTSKNYLTVKDFHLHFQDKAIYWWSKLPLSPLTFTLRS